jgi:5-methylcytosine-specific restriction endonuclease McrA
MPGASGGSEVTELFTLLGPWRVALLAVLLTVLIVVVPLLLWVWLSQRRESAPPYREEFARLVDALLEQHAREHEEIEQARLLLRKEQAEVEAWKKEQLDSIVTMMEWNRERHEELKKKYDIARINARDTAALRLDVFERDGFRCQECGYQAHDSKDRKLHVDHIVPVSMGGTNEMDNLQTLCDKCNGMKSDRLPDKFKAAA